MLIKMKGLMPFTCIHGTFHLLNRTSSGKPTGFEPDGDSVHFRATRPELLEALPKVMRPLNPSNIGSVNLRLEALDALELHFRPDGGKNTRQPAPFAEAARDELTRFLGFGEVRYAQPRGLAVLPPVANDGAPGWILSRSLEVNGRPVSFAFAGRPPFADGSRVELSPVLFKKSLNFHLLLSGLVYPLFYDSLFHDLRRAAASAVRLARKNGLGLWKEDRLLVGVLAPDAGALERDGVIFPKLFRRLNEFWADGHVELGDFKGWLQAGQERVLDAHLVNFTHFDNVISVEGNTVKLTRAPEELVFISAR